MKNENISQETIRSYLIGALDEPTTEALDELSVTSQEFADRVAAEQYNLVDDWVAGRLDASERASFATVLSRSSALREKVRVSELMTTAPRVVVDQRKDDPIGFFAGFFGRIPRLAYGLAAVVLLLGLASVIVYLIRGSSTPELAQVELPVNEVTNNSTPPPTPPEGQLADVTTPPPSNAYQPDNSNTRKTTPEPTRTAARSFVALTLTPPTRGTGEIKSVKIDSGVEYLDLTVQTEAAIDGPVRVEVADADSGKIDWTSKPLSVSAGNGRANFRVRVPVTKLRSGVRSIRLRQTGDEKTVLDEHFLRVVR